MSAFQMFCYAYVIRIFGCIFYKGTDFFFSSTLSEMRLWTTFQNITKNVFLCQIIIWLEVSEHSCSIKYSTLKIPVYIFLIQVTKNFKIAYLFHDSEVKFLFSSWHFRDSEITKTFLRFLPVRFFSISCRYLSF